ncbi:hypothetical protein JQ801_15320 [Klebsiella variicola subsp. variicola]|uniref:hypothetical protein n=1 Tax=Klebsiella variicola TaxID=244366 RepID=UPI001FB7BD20|nr:hypothetical protein [Klebsiella variicola]MCJ1834273.1 hypothetical protein [Klebsiella variicola subsp. variicola]
MKKRGRDILLKLLIPAFIVLALLYCVNAKAEELKLELTQVMNTGGENKMCVYQKGMYYTFTYMTTSSCAKSWILNTDD